jgi:hypothetical protein
MKRKSKRKQKHVAAKSVLRLPDLEVAKSAVLNSLSCPDAQRGYRHAIDEFVGVVLLGASIVVQQNGCRPLPDAPGTRHLAPRTINLRLRTVRRLWRTRRRIAAF